jgi:hypothetical protein
MQAEMMYEIYDYALENSKFKFDCASVAALANVASAQKKT